MLKESDIAYRPIPVHAQKFVRFSKVDGLVRLKAERRYALGSRQETP